MTDKSHIFSDVTFYIVGDIAEDVISLLMSEGGKRDTYLSEMVSHVIADSTEPDEYSEAKEIFERPIVSSDWVRLSIICKKQLPKERFALEGCLFSGVVACPSRLDITDSRSLWSMIIYNGGRCQLKFDKNVTHLLASGIDGVKYTEGLSKDKVKIVTPDWVSECIKQESIQDEAVYHPRLIVYPKPETPPPKPKPASFARLNDLTELHNMLGQQMALSGGPSPFARRRKSSSDDSPRNGSRPGTPSAKEALARMVSSRLQASGKSSDAAEISATITSMFPHGQYQMPGLPQSPGHTMPYGQSPIQGMPFGMGIPQGQSPNRGQSPIQGHPLAHMPGQSHPQSQMFMQSQLSNMSQSQMPPHSQAHIQTSPNQIHVQTSPNQSHMQTGSNQASQQPGQMHMKGQRQLLIPGKPHGQMSGKPHGQMSGKPHGQMSGKPHGQMSGKPHGQMSGKPHGQMSGKPLGQMSGKPHGQMSGKPHAQLSGKPHGQMSGKPHGQMSGKPHGQMSGNPQRLMLGNTRMPGKPPGLMHGKPQGQMPGKPMGQMSRFPGQIPLHHQGPLPLMNQDQLRYHGQGHIPQTSPNQMQNQIQSPLSSPPVQMRPQPPAVNFQGQPGQRMPQGLPQRLPHPQMHGQGHPQFQGHPPSNLSPGKVSPQGHMPIQNLAQMTMQGQMPKMTLPGMPTSGMMQQLQQEAFQQNRTLRNITNNAESSKSPSKQTVSKISQMLEMNRPPPPMYPGRAIPPGGLQRPQAPVPIYYGHDASENIAPDMCLLSCVFFVNDYQTLLGNDEIKTWKEVINQHGGEVEDTYSIRITHVLCANQNSEIFHMALNDQKRVVTAFWLNDCLVQKKMLPPTQALHLPVPFEDQKPCQNQIICVTNFEGEERKRLKQLITSLGAKYTGYMTHANSVLICKIPEGVKYKKAKEWKIPVVNIQWLTDLLCGHLEALRLPVNTKYLIPNTTNPFILDTNLVTRLLVGWRSPLKVSKEAWKKFVAKPKPSLDQENVNSKKRPLVDTNIEEVLSKKPRLELMSSATESPAVLFTGFTAPVIKNLQAIAKHLGLKVVENPRDCSHLVMQSLSRTMKLFVAVSACKYIITREWLDDSLDQGKLLDEEKFALKDVKAEKEFGCCIKDTLHRAQIKPLFQGMTFYMTPSVVPSIKDLTRIVISAGGTVVNRRPSAKTLINQVDDKGNPTFIVVTCNNDLHLCRDLFAHKMSVYNAEFILTGVLRQEIYFNLFTVTLPT